MTLSLHGPVIQTCNRDGLPITLTRVPIVMKSRTISILAAATAAGTMSLPAAPARADDTGFYVGANVGRVLSTYRRSDLNDGVNTAFGGTANGFTLGPSSVQKTHVMWWADVGYMVSRNFGVEGSYLYLGSLRYSAFGTLPSASGTGTTNVSVNLDIKSHGPALAMVGVLPMTNFWELDARLGAYEGKTSTTFLSVGDNTTSGRDSKSSTSLLAGVGTALTVSSHCIVRLDYMRLEHLNEQVLNRSFNVDLVTVGAAFVF